jgi:glyoxylase-like metal-dependent hydrolase (beta-lactamase superfamily II)
MSRVLRILAPNPSVYTLDGTNTWIVGSDPALVIDPGPAIDEHLADVARAAGRVGAVLVTHDHEDHAEGAVAFARRVDAPVHAWRLDGAERLRDGDRFAAGDA